MSDLSQAGRILLTIALAADMIAFAAFQWNTSFVGSVFLIAD